VVTTALMSNPEAIQMSLVPRALLGLCALLCGNGYIVGINQIYDEDIDRVNKPFLPVAAGELTVPQAWGLVRVPPGVPHEKAPAATPRLPHPGSSVRTHARRRVAYSGVKVASLDEQGLACGSPENGPRT
jgi:hypothetical protein